MRKPRVMHAGTDYAAPQPYRERIVDRAMVVEAFRAGLREDGASEAAGAAFLAVSWMNRNNPNRARAHAVEARRLNPSAWTRLTAVLGGEHAR